MKQILLFIRTTLSGGVLFLLPVVLLIMLFKHVFEIFSKISDPISKKLPDIFFGLDGSKMVTVFILLIICFIGGLLFKARRMKILIAKLEDNVLNFMPGYSLIKSVTADTVGEQIEHNMTPIFIKDETAWSPAFLVEEGKSLSIVFIPDAPKHDAGEIKIISSKLIKKLDVPVNQFSRSIKNYGKGSIEWIK